MISSKKRENKRKISRRNVFNFLRTLFLKFWKKSEKLEKSPKKNDPSPVSQKRLKKQASSDQSSGDSGRETPTTQEVKEISLKVSF